jgi:hypothetical protein
MSTNSHVWQAVAACKLQLLAIAIRIAGSKHGRPAYMLVKGHWFCQLPYLIEGIEELEVKGLLAPQGTIVIEYCYVICHRNKTAATFFYIGIDLTRKPKR